MNNLLHRKILLIICGGISAYKSLELIRLFKKQGAEVKTILTKSAKRICDSFIGSLTFPRRRFMMIYLMPKMKQKWTIYPYLDGLM